MTNTDTTARTTDTVPTCEKAETLTLRETEIWWSNPILRQALSRRSPIIIDADGIVVQTVTFILAPITDWRLESVIE